MSPQCMSCARLKPATNNISLSCGPGLRRTGLRLSIQTPMSRTEKRAFDPLRPFKKLNRSIRKRILHRRFGEEWDAAGALQSRKYASYEAYLEHQKAKLATHDFGDYDIEFRTALRER